MEVDPKPRACASVERTGPDGIRKRVAPGVRVGADRKQHFHDARPVRSDSVRIGASAASGGWWTAAAAVVVVRKVRPGNWTLHAPSSRVQDMCGANRPANVNGASMHADAGVAATKQHKLCMKNVQTHVV